MTLTPLESRVRTACLALLAAGVRPSGPKLAARIPWRTTKDLIRVRNRLIARGDLPARAGRSSSGGRGPAPIGEDERQAVIDACHAIVADGQYPSVARLRHRFPGRAGQRLAAIRDGAIEAGLMEPVIADFSNGGHVIRAKRPISKQRPQFRHVHRHQPLNAGW